MLDERRQNLFDKSKTIYHEIVDIIKNKDTSKVRYDVLSSLDLYLQDTMLCAASANGTITEEEKEVIKNLPENLERFYEKNSEYRSFLDQITAKKYENEGYKFYQGYKNIDFIDFLVDKDPEIVDYVIKKINEIFINIAAIDDCTSDAESEIMVEAVEAIKPLKRSEAAGLDKAMEELENMIGLTNVKKQVKSMVNLIKINNRRIEKDLPQLNISKHMVFTGQPGTGKTTVARIISKIYKELGILSVGNLIETDRAGLVAGYVGQTAIKTAEVIESAKGGILFIDEAYSLTSGTDNDYGKEAIDTLVKGMEDNRDDLIVIVAGYTNEMENFINANPGLRSRFNKYINFDNYSTDEMLEIFIKLCNEAQFIVGKEVKKQIEKYFESKQNDKTFGNARGVRNFYEAVIVNQATRIVEIENPTDEEFRTIEEEDLFGN